MLLKLSLFIIAILITTCGFSQDVIVLLENSIEFKVKVTEITNSVVKYKKWDNLDGPIYNLDISSISRIEYQNGQQDIFNSENIPADKNLEKDVLLEKKSTANQFSTVEGFPKVPNVNVPYSFSDNSIVELEIAELSRNKQHAGAWGKIWVTSIAGTSSNVRFSKKSPPHFLIQLDDPKANPFTVCELHLCDIKAQRSFIDTKKGAHGEQKQEGIKLDFQKLNDTGLYLITSSKKLAQGEYLFSILGETHVYAFGIDK